MPLSTRANGGGTFGGHSKFHHRRYYCLLRIAFQCPYTANPPPARAPELNVLRASRRLRYGDGDKVDLQIVASPPAGDLSARATGRRGWRAEDLEAGEAVYCELESDGTKSMGTVSLHQVH